MRYLADNTRKKKRVSIILFVLTILLIVVIAMGVIGRIWYQTQLSPVSKSSEKMTITIREGSGVKQVSALLAGQGLIKNAQVFELYVRLHNLLGNLQAGQYELSSSQSTPEIITTLTKGIVKKGSFTILPGQRIDQIKANMIKAGYSEADVTEALNPDNYKNHPALAYKPAGASLEGYLYPETFQTTSSTTPSQIVKQSLDEMATILTPDLIDKFKQHGLSVHQAITLASMVLKEANTAADRQMVAGVFYNRLAAGMILGSDVTYQYIADVTGQPRSAAIDSPYNTRKYGGLPPGPIGAINESSLAAVANPKSSNYLYFVAGDDGKIYFSKTQAEHDALTRQYCKVLCSTY